MAQALMIDMPTTRDCVANCTNLCTEWLKQEAKLRPYDSGKDATAPFWHMLATTPIQALLEEDLQVVLTSSTFTRLCVVYRMVLYSVPFEYIKQRQRVLVNSFPKTIRKELKALLAQHPEFILQPVLNYVIISDLMHD
jgi:hypothetical protein